MTNSKKSLTKSNKRWSRNKGATMVEWVALIAVIVALGIPLSKMLFGKLGQAADKGGSTIVETVNGK